MIQRNRWLWLTFGGFVLLLGAALLPPAFSHGRTHVGVARDWRFGAWSDREVEWDEAMPGEPPPPQVYQVHVERFGPFIVATRRRVPPTPREALE